jgi:hypothetical protein
MFRYAVFVMGLSFLLPNCTWGQSPPTVGSVKVSMCKDRKAAKLRDCQIVTTRKGELIVLRNGLKDPPGFHKPQAEWDLYRSNDLEFVSTTKLDDSNEGGERIRWETLVNVGGECRVIGITTEPPNRIYCRLINATPGDNEGRANVIHTWDTKIRQQIIQSPYGEELLTIQLSPDSNRILILCPFGITKEGHSYGLLVLDRDLSVVWSQELSVASRTAIFTLKDAAVDNEGTAFLFTTSQFFNNKERVAQGADIKSLVQQVSPKGVSTYEVKLGPDLKVYQGQCSTTVPGQIVCAGTYGDLRLIGGHTKGQFMFSQNIDHPHDAQLFQQRYDSTKLQLSGSGESTLKEQQSLLRKFSRSADLVDLFVDSTGSYMISEESSTEGNSDGNGNYTLTYVHGDVLIQRLDLNGKEVWSRLIQRDRKSKVESAGKILSMIRNNHLILFLSISKYEAFHQNDKEYICPGNSLIPMLVKFDPSGGMKMEALSCDDDIDHISGPQILDVGDGAYITMGHANSCGGRKVPVRIQFNE